MVSVTIKNLTKKYGETVAVKDLNLEIKDQEFFILLGPSGCGKTTTLLCIAGLLKPDEGEVWLGNELVSSSGRDMHVTPQKREVAMMFQDYAIYPHMTVFKNIAFPLEVRGKDKREIVERVTTTAKLLGISQLLDRKPKQLSGGQRQRVALGRAIVRKPRVFLLDEPLANLDAKLRVKTRTELKELQRKLGVTTVYVTHDQVEAMTMADRIIVQRDGVTEQIGTPDELYNRPANLFVAGFIGSPEMNFTDCTLIKDGKKLWLDAKEFKIPVPAEIVPKLESYVGEDVIMGIRPEDLYEREFVKEGTQKNAFRMTVDIIEHVGPYLLLYLRKGRLSLVARVKHTKAGVGQEASIEMDLSKIHLFDKKTTKAIL
ncbi:MAG: ABC transporter ATP-binding protein [Candidatus Bathyarchaeota archaeon]|nr:ABC transporter ATP-binding protein [Candidatus Bathyarchaeota archaeon]MDH5745330.1 ABC transporter ATP-binding protein [Candidatus Bathyarchaeota archaeon]